MKTIWGYLTLSVMVFTLGRNLSGQIHINPRNHMNPAKNNDPYLFGKTGSSIRVPDQSAPQLNTAYASGYDEFMVNELAGPARCTQRDASMDMNSGGRAVIVWEDTRDGLRKIYGQIFDQANRAGPNFVVTDEGSRFGGPNPCVAIDSTGDFVVAWTDGRSGATHVYCRRFLSDGTPLGSSFQVDDSNEWKCFPFVDMDASGNFVVVWRDMRHGWDDDAVYGQRFTASGEKAGDNFRISSSTNNIDACVTLQDDGSFIVVWSGYAGGHADIYAQNFDAGGDPSNEQYIVNTDAGNLRVSRPGVEADSNGNYVVTWKNISSMMFRRYLPDGTPAGDPVLAGEGYQGPVLAMHDNGIFLVAWESERKVMVQHFTSSGTPLGSSFQINEDTENWIWFGPRAAGMDGAWDAWVVWYSGPGSAWDIYAQRFDGDGNLDGQNIMVNDDSEWNSTQDYSRIAADERGNFYITWMDNRDGLGDIYLQRMTRSGLFLGGNIKVNDESEQDYKHWDEAIASDSNGRLLIVWEDRRTWNAGVGAQWYDSEGRPAGPNFLLCEDADWVEEPNAAMNDSGFAVAAWVANISGGPGNSVIDVVAQRFDEQGNALGDYFIVTDTDVASLWSLLGIAIDDTGNFVITWSDSRNGCSDVYMQRYRRDGTAIGSNTRINDNSDGTHQWIGEILMNDDGSYIIGWDDYRSGSAEFWGQRFTAGGEKIGSNFKLQDAPDCRMAGDGNGRNLLIWCTGGVAYAQKFDTGWQPINEPFMVSQSTGGYQLWTDAVIKGDKIYTTWTDTRPPGTGYNIWSRVLDWEDAAKVDNDTEIPGECVLLDNFPNPFNSSTTIQYTLDRSSHVRLHVYSIQGKRVASLLNAYRDAGSYRTVWHADEVSSGLYILRLIAGDHVVSKKVMLVR
jgi:hypothetical protein